MTRLSGDRGVTKWLRARRAALAAPAAESSNAGSGDAPPIDVTVPEGVVIVLPAAEHRALEWDRPPSREERQSVTVTPGVTQPIDVRVTVTTGAPRTELATSGTQRASKKSKRGKQA